MSKSRKQRQRSGESNQQGYKPVEYQNADKEEEKEKNSSPIVMNPYKIAGKAKKSKSGMVLSIRLEPLTIEDKPRHITILRQDIYAIFEDGDNKTVALVREYDNMNTNA